MLNILLILLNQKHEDMIIDSIISLKIKDNWTLSYYQKFLENIKIGDDININVEQLPKNSSFKVKVKCDICGCEKMITYQKYNKNTEKHKIYTCKKCFNIKNKKTCLEIYDNENYNNREKYKKTINYKYNVDNVSQIDSIKIKKQETCMSNYLVSNPSQNHDIQLKIKETLLRKNMKKYNNLLYIKDNIYTFSCEEGHEFNITRELLKNRKNLNTILCTVCNPIDTQISGKELQLVKFIRDNYENDINIKDRSHISKELDIYLPDLKLAFEFNGLFWHSELYKENNYHLNKTEECEKQGIQLIHIYEDDWIYKQDIIKSMILNKLGKITNKIYARKCNIEEINNNKIIREFLDKNHIQGFVGSKLKLGLFYDNELVSLMTFGNRRVAMGKKSTNENEYELLRFCNKLNTNIIGGASKLFNYFVKNYNPSEITTYADRSFSQGNLYKQLGFEFVNKTEPNYYYIIDGVRYHRFNYRKDLLIKQGFDPNKTEHQIMLDRKIYRIYDSGNLKFNLTI